MLVLSRLRDEVIIISSEHGPIEITVVDIRGDKVRLGFTAPQQIAVHRKEVWDEIQRENRARGEMGGLLQGNDHSASDADRKGSQ